MVDSMNAHEIEEMEFGQGSRLWDAGEGVCCAAFQLGACPHTEGDDGYYEEEEADFQTRLQRPYMGGLD
jgi:hypothetical protein